MDLAAAVSDSDPNIPGSGDWLVQFTNNGLYTNSNKYSASGLTQIEDQWQFWCNGSGLADCTKTDVFPRPYDTQVSYNWHVGRWIYAALSAASKNSAGGHLYLAATSSPDPTATPYRTSLTACSDIFTGTYGDNPIMGISHGGNGASGRVVVDLQCLDSSSGGYVGEEIFDVDISALQQGTLGSTCAAPNCQIFCSNSSNKLCVNSPNPYLYEKTRPVNNLGSSREIWLSSAYILNGQPALFVYKLKPGATASVDTLSVHSPPGQANTPFPGPAVSISNNGNPKAPQPNCGPGSNCEVLTDALDPDNGGVQTNSAGSDIFATSFSAQNSVNGNNSHYFAFVLNTVNGNYNWIEQTQKGGMISYSNAAIDPDNELLVNYTTFTSSGSNTSVDIIDYSPISSASYVNSYPAIFGSTAELTSACSTTSNVCRWGDYTTEIYDPACNAANAGYTSECGLFWTTAENTPDGTTQQSNVFALYDTVTQNDVGKITFINSSNTESECTSEPCAITFNAPSNVQNGDVLLAVISADFALDYLPALPTGWTALGFVNQSGSQNFTSFDPSGNRETGWALVHTYGSTSPETGQYTFTENVSPGAGEFGGLLLDYRGVNTSQLNYPAYGFNSGGDAGYVQVGPIPVGASQQLVAVFKDGADDDMSGENTSGITYSSPVGYPPGLTAETPLTITGDAWTGMAGDIWTGIGSGVNGNDFWYSSDVSAQGQTVIGLPLGWEVLLPTGLQ